MKKCFLWVVVYMMIAFGLVSCGGSSNTTATESPSSINISNPGDASEGDAGLVGRHSSIFLPDTGQTKCYDTSGYIINCTDHVGIRSSGEYYVYGNYQDGTYAINSPAYSVLSDGTVYDKNTGLAWQREDDDQVRQWSSAVAYCNDLQLGGHDDWRLPTKKELILIVDYGRSISPVIDPSFFPNTNAAPYWTYTSYAENTSSDAWYLDFSNGYTQAAVKEANYNYVRCVRGASYDGPSFLVDGNGTVTDTSTGLRWQQRETGPMTWSAALTYCNSLVRGNYDNYVNGWRLPNIKELSSLTNDALFRPALDTSAFPGTLNTSSYWSSTSNSAATGSAWYMHFGTGVVNSLSKANDTLFVRCVQGNGGRSGFSFNEAARDYGHSAIEMSDGKFAVVGSTFASTDSNEESDVLLVKTTPNGVLQWSKKFSRPGNQDGYSLVETDDGGFMIAGQSKDDLSGFASILLMKVNSAGDVEWTKGFETQSNSIDDVSLLKTCDQRFIIYAPGTLIKVDFQGNLEWSTSAPLRDVIVTTDCGLAGIGSRHDYEGSGRGGVYGSGTDDVLLQKMDADGNVQWSKMYHNGSDEHGLSLIETTDGGFAILADQSDPMHLVSLPHWFIKTDSTGGVQSSKTFYELGNVGASNSKPLIVETSDGGFVLSGNTAEGAGGILLKKITSTGNHQWSKVIDGVDPSSLKQTVDGGFLIAGSTSPRWSRDYISNNISDLLIIKTDSGGVVQ